MDDEAAGIALTSAGVVIVIAGVILPLMTITYSPPGGSASLYGHQIRAFHDTITGLQFATTASYTHVLLAVLALIGLSIFRPILALLDGPDVAGEVMKFFRDSCPFGGESAAGRHRPRTERVRDRSRVRNQLRPG